MIARYQTILFAVLLIASIAMGGILWHLRERAHQRLIAGEDSAPTKAPQVAPAEQATLLVANDADKQRGLFSGSNLGRLCGGGVLAGDQALVSPLTEVPEDAAHGDGGDQQHGK